MAHTIIGIRYEKDKVTAICSCDWESAQHDSETDARAEAEKHIKKPGR